MLFGKHGHAQWHQLVLLRRYLTRVNATFGFSPAEAQRARRVTIIGDTAQVSLETEAELKRAGVRVERWLGDLNALEIILRDRLTQNSELGN